MSASYIREVEMQSAFSSDGEDEEDEQDTQTDWGMMKYEAKDKVVTAWWMMYQNLKRTHIQFRDEIKKLKHIKPKPDAERARVANQLRIDLNRDGDFKKICYLTPDLIGKSLKALDSTGKLAKDVPGYEDVFEAYKEAEEFNPSLARLRILHMFQALQAYSLGSEFLQKFVLIAGDSNFLGTPGIILPVLPTHRLPLRVIAAKDDQLLVPSWAGDEELGGFRGWLKKTCSKRSLLTVVWDALLRQSMKAAHCIAYSWSPLLDKNMPIKERFYILHALGAAERSESVFTTLVGAHIEETSWDLVKWQFGFFTIARELIGVLLLFNVGYMIRNERQPNQWNIILTLCLSIITLVKMIVEIVLHCYLYCKETRPFAGLRMYFSGWNPLFFVFEIYVVVIVVWAASSTDPGAACTWSEEVEKEAQTCWYLKHPIFLVLVVIMRWVYLICCLLCIRVFGQQVYCSFASLISPPSIWFILFYSLCVFASFFAYYMFPIEENIKKNAMGLNHTAGFTNGPTDMIKNLVNLFNNENIMTFMKIFRLDVMGDFDLWELEGVDPVVKAAKVFNSSSSIEEGDVMAELDDGERSQIFHRGINLFFVLMATAFNVAFLNVYIGLLGQVYEELFGFRHQIFAEFRSSFCAKELIWPYMIKRCFSCCSSEDESDDDRPYVLTFQNREKYALSYSQVQFNELDEDDTEEKEEDEQQK